jgi:hypothetical protein
MKKILYFLLFVANVAMIPSCSKHVDKKPDGGGNPPPPPTDSVSLTLIKDSADTFQVGANYDLIISKLHIPSEAKNFTITQLRNPAQDTGYVSIDNYNYLLYKSGDDQKTPEASGLFNKYDFTTSVSIALASGDHILVYNGSSSEKGKFQGQAGFQCSYTLGGVTVKKEITVISDMLVFK